MEWIVFCCGIFVGFLLKKTKVKEGPISATGTIHNCGHRRRDKGLGDIVLSGIMAIGKLFRSQETSGLLRRLCDTPPAFLIIIASLVFET